MRWEALFADLEGQLAAAAQAGLEAEIADRQRGESAGIEFADRLRGQMGRRLRLHLGQGTDVLSGDLVRLGNGWLLLRASADSHLVPLEAVHMVEGMDRFSAADTAGLQLGLQAALRGLARDRYPVRLTLRGGPSRSLHGSIDRVGRDFVEIAVLADGQARRRENVATTVMVPLHELLAVSSGR